MTFKELQDAVIADAFDESDRDQVKNWINHRYGLLMNQYEWTFVETSAPVTVTAGSQTVTSVPADFGTAVGLQRADGWPLTPISEYRTFARRYVGTNNNQAGQPCEYTVQDTAIFVGPTSNETSSSYLLTYEKNVTLLVADENVPVIPPEHHLALVFGGKADGLGLKNVLLADPFERLFNNEVQAMTRKYLVEIRGASTQVGAYRPDRRTV